MAETQDKENKPKATLIKHQHKEKPSESANTSDEPKKKVVKKKKQLSEEEKKLTSSEEFEGDLLLKTCEILKTQPEHVTKTINRFMKELYIYFIFILEQMR